MSRAIFNEEYQKIQEKKYQIERLRSLQNKLLSKENPLRLDLSDLPRIKPEDTVSDNYIASLENANATLQLYRDLLENYIENFEHNSLAIGSLNLIEGIQDTIRNRLDNVGSDNDDTKKAKYNLIVEGYKVIIKKQQQFEKSMDSLILQLENDIKILQNPTSIQKIKPADNVKESKQEIDEDSPNIDEHAPLLSTTNPNADSQDSVKYFDFDSLPPEILLKIIDYLDIISFVDFECTTKSLKNNAFVKEAWRNVILAMLLNLTEEQKKDIKESEDPKRLLTNTIRVWKDQNLLKSHREGMDLSERDEENRAIFCLEIMCLPTLPTALITLLAFGCSPICAFSTLFSSGGGGCLGFMLLNALEAARPTIIRNCIDRQYGLFFQGQKGIGLLINRPSLDYDGEISFPNPYADDYSRPIGLAMEK